MQEEDYYDDDEELIEYAVRPNKSQIKRDIAVVFAMAEEICDLAETQIDSLELPENIYKAVLEAAKMPHKGARKRQLKYITAQLRKIDLEAVQEKLARIKNQSAHAVREHHQAEQWRDQLLSENGHEQLTRLLSEFPQADSQHIWQLQRNALKERQAEKPPRSARLLYQYLKELISTN
ncbi:ribosome biogenesis factor YjgA [Methylomarinum vadi]|uniref:ribosome biogenesis factor YjgA n=1 Tax=Methylomarinum vadi TaxID=438855 RepID=UPI0004DF1ABF|nr:ribosome biogenesis factor YjgA [Methylomarinum vadi]